MSEGKTVEGISMADFQTPYRASVMDFQPAFAEAISRFGPVGAVKMVTASMIEQLAAQPRPKSRTAAAIMRGLSAKERLKQEEGGSYSAEETRVLLKISKAAVLKRFQKGQLLGWREARQAAVRFPVWQFKDDDLLPGMAEILATFSDISWMDEWARIGFFLGRRQSLEGKRPLDLLREGLVQHVRAMAEEIRY